MAQHIKKLAEEQKVSCRNVRRDANKALDQAEKDGELSEDERDKQKDKVQQLLKSYEGKIDEMAAKKEKEVMEG
jgi:ribosome recycling factor